MSNKIIEILVVTWLHQNKTLIIKSYNYRIVHNFLGKYCCRFSLFCPLELRPFGLYFKKVKCVVSRRRRCKKEVSCSCREMRGASRGAILKIRGSSRKKKLPVKYGCNLT